MKAHTQQYAATQEETEQIKKNMSFGETIEEKSSHKIKKEY